MQWRDSGRGLKLGTELGLYCGTIMASTSSRSKVALVVVAAMIENCRIVKAGCQSNPAASPVAVADCLGASEFCVAGRQEVVH